MTDQTIHFPLNPVIPGAYSVVDASALIDSETRQGSPVVGVAGDCKGGAPNTALAFTRPQALKSVLRSGPAFDAARLAFVGGASRVIVVRAGTPTQSVAALAGATGTPVTLTSIDYGAWTASIKRTVEANNKLTITYTDANGVTYTEVFNCGASATAQDVADFVNGKKPGVGASAYVTAAVTSGTMPLSVAAIASLPTAGTDDGTIDAGDWTTALTAFETQDVDFVQAATGDATIHAQVWAHCNAMSAPGARRERTTVLGGIAGESVATVIARMSTLRQPRVQLVYPGASLYDANGNLTAYDPFYIAALVAGMHASLPDAATSLTHADVAVFDVEKRLSRIQGGDVEQLLQANISPIVPRPGGGFMLEDSLSGYQADPSLRDFHKTRTADKVAQRLRTRLEGKFVGKKVLDDSRDEVLREAIHELTDQRTETLIRAFRQPAVVASPSDPRTTLVTAPVMLPDTNKYILITVALQPPSTAAAGVAVNP